MTKEKTTSKGKFEELLNANSKTIKANRAKLIAEDAQIAQADIVREIQDRKRSLQRELLDLTDLHPDSELSLTVIKKDADIKSVFKKIQSLKVQLIMIERELQIAEETQKEWFN